MRDTAYKLTGFTVVASAVGFLLRWLQNLNIIDEETGLAEANMPISWFVVVVIIVVAVALLGICLRFRNYDGPKEPENALGNTGFLFTVIGIIAVALLAVSAIGQFIQANLETWGEGHVGIHRVCALGALASAVGAGVLILWDGRPEKGLGRRVGAVVLVLFGCLWLITTYQSSAANPVIWSYALSILGESAAVVALYYIAGYYFDDPHPKLTIFFCELGAFLCIISALDDRTISGNLCFAAMALLMLDLGGAVTAGLHEKNPEEGEKTSLAEDEETCKTTKDASENKGETP